VNSKQAGVLDFLKIPEDLQKQSLDQQILKQTEIKNIKKKSKG
jgi:hypothetical protein